jgi:8-oxo-dGTP pyrophosphatase MutT (NUDIX family)
VFGNSYGTLYDDDVVGSTGRVGRYLRWSWARPGVVVIPVRGDEIALAAMYRYPIAESSLELPRGGVDADEPVSAAAARELAEELGLRTASVEPIGEVFADTGLIATPLSVVVAEVATAQDPAWESMESIGIVRWFTRDSLRTQIAEARLRCGISLAALALYWSRGCDEPWTARAPGVPPRAGDPRGPA